MWHVLEHQRSKALDWEDLYLQLSGAHSDAHTGAHVNTCTPCLSMQSSGCLERPILDALAGP